MHSATSEPRPSWWRPPVARAGRVALTATFVLGMSAPALVGAAPARAQASGVSFSTTEAAPADAVAYLVTTLDTTSDQWTLADTLLDRAGVGPVLEEEFNKEMQDESSQKVPLDAFLGGEAAVVVSRAALDQLAEESMGTSDLDEMLGSLGVATPETSPAGPEPQGFAVALDATAPDTAWAGIRESVRDQPTEEQDYQGTSILYAPPATSDDEGMAAARDGDLILIATTPADLYPLIDTIDGRTPNITTVPEFATARDALPTDFLSFGFVNSVPEMGANLGPMAPLAGELSTDSFSAFTIAADQPGFRMETVTIPPAGGASSASADHYQSELIEQAPENALFFASAANLGDTGVLDVIGATLLGLAFGMGGASMMNPEATPVAANDPEAMIAKQFEDAAALIGVNLQTELFHQFTGEFGGWVTSDAATQQVSGLFASKTENPDTVANSLMQISYLIQGATGSESLLSTREVAGGQIYVLDLGDEVGSTLEFGVIDGQFVLGSGDAIDRMEGAAGSSLADNAQFTSVMQTLPSEYNGIVYVDLTQAIPLAKAASEEAESMDMLGSSEMEDAGASCANYGSQAEAQAAYDAAEPDTFDLDQDFDGQACEDFFASSMATPVAAVTQDEGEDPFANIDYSAVKAYAMVAHNDDGMQRSSAILYIAQ